MRKAVSRAGVAGLGALALVLVAAPAEAGGCYRSRAVYTTYQAYAAPAVTYSYVPKAVEVQKSPDYYFSTADYFRDKLLVDAIAGRMEQTYQQRGELQELRQEIQLLRRQMFQQQPPPEREREPPPPRDYEPPPPRKEREPIPPPRKDREPPPSPHRKGAGTLPPASERLRAAVNTSCASCHGASADRNGGGLDLRDLDALPQETRLLSYALANSGAMPKGRAPVTDEVVVELYQWATGLKIAPPKK